MPESPAAQSAYDVLGVSPTSTEDELRRAYRLRLRETHPDTGGSATQFQAVQVAWSRIGTAADRAIYDAGSGNRFDRSGGETGAGRGSGSGGGAGSGMGSRASGASQGTPSTLKARSFGHPGGDERVHYLTLMREWVGRGVELKDPYDPALVRSAPREIRRWLAKAIAEEETARIVSTMGIGFTVWNNVLVGRTGENIDHVVLGPAGLFAIASHDWGSEVRLSKSELVGDDIADDEEPLRNLGQSSRMLSKSLGVKFTALVVVVPDEDLAVGYAQVERGRIAGAVVVRRSVLPQLLRNGVSGVVPGGRGGPERASVDRIFELRSRLQDSIRFV
ncbi:DnaJ domain-containing protein [Subtercola sp. PAMC28395]|uniref:DnaJ domain-containing protein n=1 Tax=Subtercola sp. PAMC28395 TaxID=2846775 RepID=UPI001C0B8724|nr:DnaJ domain-containing protein [Subtercola sp. PAMC28395]QWT23142.1 DnaJ domain-containing protein [Subtercola sp. PAMC28395]